MPRALLSVSDKTGIVEFARGLAARGYELMSTGGTARAGFVLETARAAREGSFDDYQGRSYSPTLGVHPTGRRGMKLLPIAGILLAGLGAFSVLRGLRSHPTLLQELRQQANLLLLQQY